jgi:hypothetical protein
VNHIQQDISFFISFVGSVNHIAYKAAIMQDSSFHICLQQTCSTFGVVGAATAIFVLHADNMKFGSQNEE